MEGTYRAAVPADQRFLFETLWLAFARRDGLPAVSLSVEPDNRARSLYERLGFRKVGEVGGAWTLLRSLDEA